MNKFWGGLYMLGGITAVRYNSDFWEIVFAFCMAWVILLEISSVKEAIKARHE